MPTFNELIGTIKTGQQHLEELKKHAQHAAKEIGAPVVYYAATRNRSVPGAFKMINAEDKVLFSDAIEDIEGDKLALIVDSDGGEAEATEQIVGILRPRFKDITYVVPDRAMSAATLLALAADRIMMDERSALGPIDPQVFLRVSSAGGGQPMYEPVPAQAVVAGFEKAKEAIKKEGPAVVGAYLPLLDKYRLDLFEVCNNATALSEELASTWLSTYMFCADEKPGEKAARVAQQLADHGKHKSHGRQIGVDKAKELGLTVVDMRDKKSLRDQVWRVHCLGDLWFERNPACYKLCMNSRGLFTSKLHGIPVMQQPPKMQPGAGP